MRIPLDGDGGFVMRRYIVDVVGLVVWLLVAAPVHAFDGQRGGFVLGFGVGPAVTSYTQTLYAADGTEMWASDRENQFGIGTDLKIGGGIGRRLLLYYINRVSWFTLDVGHDAIFANSVGLVGLSYYFQDESPALYVLGLVGLSTWDAPFEENWDAQVGFGLGAGLGWEFSRHWSLEATFNWGNPGGEEFPATDEYGNLVGSLELETNPVSILITVNGLAY
jgi:opacity protein-like surface antigen